MTNNIIKKVENVVYNVITKNKTGNKIIDNLFGEFYSYYKNPSTILRGWDFRYSTIKKALSRGIMYHADIDIPYPRCNLNCDYCFVKDDRRFKHLKLLSFNEWVDGVKQLKEEGIETIKIVGMGENTEDRNFFKYLEVLQNLEIKPVVFTNGHVFGDEELTKKIHGLSVNKMIDKTFNAGASVLIKFDSPRSSIQDAIVKSPGYSKLRDKAIKIFLKRSDLIENNISRFGLEINLGAHNIEDIFEIYALRKLTGIYIDICLSMDCDAIRYLKEGSKISGLTQKQIEDIYVGIYYMNKLLRIKDEGTSPYMGVIKCAQISLPSLYLNGGGDIYFACCGNTKNKIGNIRNMNIKEARDKAKELSSRYSLPQLHGCPFREEAGIINPDLFKRVEERVNKLTHNQ